MNRRFRIHPGLARPGLGILALACLAACAQPGVRGESSRAAHDPEPHAPAQERGGADVGLAHQEVILHVAGMT